MRIDDNSLRRYLMMDYGRLTPRRFKLERKVFIHFFPSTKTIIDEKGKINFVSKVGNGSDVRSVRIVLPFSYPYTQPKCWIAPKPKSHTYIDGSMCVHFSGGWGPERCAAQVLVAACELLWGKK